MPQALGIASFVDAQVDLVQVQRSANACGEPIAGLDAPTPAVRSFPMNRAVRSAAVDVVEDDGDGLREVEGGEEAVA